MLLQLDQGFAAGDTGVKLMPEGDVILAQSPAQPDGPAGGEGREVDQAGSDVPQGDAPGIELAYRPLHPSHGLGHLLLLAFDSSAIVLDHQLPDAQLGRGDGIAIIAQIRQHRAQVFQPPVGGSEIVIAGHVPILACTTATACERAGVRRTRPRTGARVGAMRLAGRMQDIGTESAFEAGARARVLAAAGRDIISLHIGEPDFRTPPNVVEVAHRAMADGHTHYAPPLGVPDFREAIAADFSRRRGVEVSPDRVVVTPGAKPVVAFALMALAGPGDEVIVPDPGFPIYESMTRFLGATPVPIPLRMCNDFRLDLDELRALVTPRTRLLVINSPQNPTGSVLTRHDLEGIAAVAIANDLVVLSDEIYSRLVYESDHHSILAIDGMAERTIVLDGLSKAYAMTGWRLGWGIVPAPLVAAFERLLINTVSCTATYAQLAGVEALSGPQDPVDAMAAEFRTRRALMVEGLDALPGVTAPMPHGAFYAFPDVSGTGMDGATLAARLLDEAGVCVLAGTAFGRVASGHLRVSYANSEANLSTALDRMADFLTSGQGERLSAADPPPG